VPPAYTRVLASLTLSLLAGPSKATPVPDGKVPRAAYNNLSRLASVPVFKTPMPTDGNPLRATRYFDLLKILNLNFIFF